MHSQKEFIKNIGKSGQVYQAIRKSKHLAMTDVADSEVSQSQISRFERGESSMTIDKFMRLLENTSVTLDEFESIYDNFSLSEEYAFREELAQAVDTRNTAKVRAILKDWEARHKAEPQKRYPRINCIVVKTVLSNLADFSMPRDDMAYLKDYLMSVEDWGRYELWAFSNCIQLFNDATLNMVEAAILGRVEFYKNISLNNQLVIRTTLNLISIFIQRKNFRLALKYINYLDGIHISIDFLYEKLMLRYNKGFYRYKMGDKSGLEVMKECNDILGTLGCFEEENVGDKELESLSK
ncbi:MAG: helix-turn-helix domain-containing protein [Streptococcaceae bacterium]|jgi:Rgg/GadR/MutR family transcriptional activator|nr:helix-turn-helix domain-containing protein [Streptococcaceae bacterium]